MRIRPSHLVLALALTALSGAPAHAQEQTVPDPHEALQRMSVYLGTLDSFEVQSDSSLDLITMDDQKIDLDGVTTYQVRRPGNFVIENQTDRRWRRFIFDGERLTVHSPTSGFYASAPLSGSIADVLGAAEAEYGITLPLVDLFHWSDPNHEPREIQEAEYIGPAVVDGVEADQFAFREEEVDWQIWIRRGAEPVPLKIAIVDRIDPTHPEFTARLSWNTSPSFSADTFAFNPDSDDRPIQFVSE